MNLLLTRSLGWREAWCATAVGVLLLTGLIAARGDEISTLEEVNRFFNGDMLAVAWSAGGEAQLCAIVDTLKAALGVPDPSAVDEGSEESVNRVPVADDLRPIVLQLAQAYFELGNAFSGGDLDALTAFKRGKNWGMKGLRMSPQFAYLEREHGFEVAVAQETNIGLLFWTCLCWLRCAEADPLIAVVGGAPSKTLSMLERCVELDPGYAACGPYRALAGFWGGLPDLPLPMLHRNLALALSYSCRAITTNPFCPDSCDGRADCERFLENRLTFVKYYLLPSNEVEQAVRVLQEIVAATWDAFYPLHNPLARYEAERLLENISQDPTN